MRLHSTPILLDLEQESADIAAHVVATIRAEVVGYSTFPRADHVGDAAKIIEDVIRGLRTSSGPTPEAIAHARRMGRNRASAGVSLEDAVEGYHIAYRELWTLLLDRAKRSIPDMTGDVLGEVSLMWTWFHRISSAFADDYVDEQRAIAASRRTARDEFLHSLTSGKADPGACENLAVGLGFDPAADFVVVRATIRGDGDVEEINRLIASADRANGIAHCTGGVSDTCVVIAQGWASGQLVGLVCRVHPAAAVGIGLTRAGLDGAAHSAMDADDALGRSQMTGVPTDFGDDWLASLVTAAGPRVDQLLEAGREVEALHPQLAATVRMYAAQRYSATACARQLCIHPNSVKYRLRRWTELTGWDVHTFDGLARTLISLDHPIE